MPEGHSVRRLADAFTRGFVGHRVTATSPQGRFTDGAAAIDGLVLEQADAHGKQMFLRFGEDRWLRVHLGLYGMWRFAGGNLEGVGRRTARPRRRDDAPVSFPPSPLGAVRLRLLADHAVADLSGPTACAVLTNAERLAFMRTLGADPLRDDADPARAYARIAASRTAIGALLMRQDIVAGIGNIYRADLLFRARIEPHRPGRDVSRDQWDALWADAVARLRDGVRDGRIVTTRPEHRARRSGPVRRIDRFYVAGRAGFPCRICSTPVSAERMAGRTLFWCPTCQTE